MRRSTGPRLMACRLMTNAHLGFVVVIVAWLVLTTGAPVFAQATGAFNGRITDSSGLVIPGVTATATHVRTGIVRTTVTNSEGLYTLPGLEPGPYEVKAEGGKVYISGENPGIRLLDKEGGTALTAISFWRVIWSPEGPAHVCFVTTGDGKSTGDL